MSIYYSQKTFFPRKTLYIYRFQAIYSTKNFKQKEKWKKKHLKNGLPDSGPGL